MSDMLSQEEIDALLNQNSSDDEKNGASAASTNLEEYLTPIEQDTLGEIGNISFGSASTALSTLLSQKVDITTPKLSVVKQDELKNEFPDPHVAVHVEYTSGFQGINLLVIQNRDAQVIADLMLGGDGHISEESEIEDLHISAVQEAMNQMMGSAATSMSTIFDKRIAISPPGIDIFDVHQGERGHPLNNVNILIQVAFRIKIGDLIDSHIMQLLTVPFAKQMVGLLLHPDQTNEEDSAQSDRPNSTQPDPRPESTSAPIQSESIKRDNHDPKHSRHNIERSANVESVQFTPFDEQSTDPAQRRNLDLLMDIPLQVTVELGRTKRAVKDILELSPGSIVELDKLAGEPVDILVNDKLIAKGEVVVIEENFGVRVTDILSQWDRIQKLQ